MKWKVILVGLLVSMTAMSLLIPAEGHDQQQLADFSPLVKYASGRHINQVYSMPRGDQFAAPQGSSPATWVQNLGEKQAPLAGSSYKLRPRLIARLCGTPINTGSPVALGAAGQPHLAAPEKLSIFDFDLVYENLPVAYANRTVVMREGRLIAIRDRNMLTSMEKPASTTATVPLATAWGLAVQNSRNTLAQLYPGAETARLIGDAYPSETPRLVLWPDQRDKKMQLAYYITVRSTTKAQPYLRRYYVTAQHPARILDFEDLLFYQTAPGIFPRLGVSRPPLFGPGSLLNPRTTAASQNAQLPARHNLPDPNTVASLTAEFAGPFSGTVTAATWEGSPYTQVVPRPMPYMQIKVARPGGGSYVTHTDAYGRYQIPEVRGRATVKVSLDGQACRIINEQSASQGHALFINQAGAGVVNVDFPAQHGEEFKLAQTSAYFHVTQAYDFVREFLPERPTKLPQLTTHVNINNSCNAYYDRSENSLNFFRSGNSCPNTAYRDVIFHEYGHAVDEELGGVLDGAYSEGFGDALVQLMTNSPFVGTDFYGPGKPLRDSRKMVMFSPAKDVEVHEGGLVYSGFCWELLQQLHATYPSAQATQVARQLILGAAVQNPKDIPDAVRLSFFLDSQFYPSTQGGSLHYRQLQAAALSRNLPIPREAHNLTSPLVAQANAGSR